MRLSLVMLVASLALARAQDKCPRPDEIAPCQCRTRGPSIQVRWAASFLDILYIITITTKDPNSPHKYPVSIQPHPSERAGSRANDIHLNVLTLLFLKRFPVPIVTKHLISTSLELERACPWLHPVLASPHWWGPWWHCSQISHVHTSTSATATVKVSTKSWGIFTIFSLLKVSPSAFAQFFLLKKRVHFKNWGQCF